MVKKCLFPVSIASPTPRRINITQFEWIEQMCDCAKSQRKSHLDTKDMVNKQTSLAADNSLWNGINLEKEYIKVYRVCTYCRLFSGISFGKFIRKKWRSFLIWYLIFLDGTSVHNAATNKPVTWLLFIVTLAAASSYSEQNIHAYNLVWQALYLRTNLFQLATRKQLRKIYFFLSDLFLWDV